MADEFLDIYPVFNGGFESFLGGLVQSDSESDGNKSDNESVSTDLVDESSSESSSDSSSDSSDSEDELNKKHKKHKIDERPDNVDSKSDNEFNDDSKSDNEFNDDSKSNNDSPLVEELVETLTEVDTNYTDNKPVEKFDIVIEENKKEEHKKEEHKKEEHKEKLDDDDEKVVADIVYGDVENKTGGKAKKNKKHDKKHSKKHNKKHDKKHKTHVEDIVIVKTVAEPIVEKVVAKPVEEAVAKPTIEEAVIEKIVEEPKADEPIIESVVEEPETEYVRDVAIEDNKEETNPNINGAEDLSTYSVTEIKSHADLSSDEQTGTPLVVSNTINEVNNEVSEIEQNLNKLMEEYKKASKDVVGGHEHPIVPKTCEEINEVDDVKAITELTGGKNEPDSDSDEEPKFGGALVRYGGYRDY